MRQPWADIAFVHGAVDPSRVARFMPAGVRPGVLGGSTYVGVVPSRMQRAGLGLGPAVPWWGTFHESDVRFYPVDGAGRHGVAFLSLDSSRLLVSALARIVLGAPYTWARMRIDQDGDRHEAAGLPGPAATAPTSVLWSEGTLTTFGRPRAVVPRRGAAPV